MAVAVTSNIHPSYAPTNIQVALHTIHMSPLDDQWLIYISATSHMTINGSNHKSYLKMSNNINFGCGHSIPVIVRGNALVPYHHHSLTPNIVSHASKLIKNVVCVIKFTIDRDIYIVFDPFGFFINDF